MAELAERHEVEEEYSDEGEFIEEELGDGGGEGV